MKSSAGRRMTTKKGASNAIDVDDVDFGIHASANNTNDFDADYDDIILEHVETTFEKSIAPQKRARILGGSTRKQRGTFGGGAGTNSKPKFFNNKSTTPTTRNEKTSRVTTTLRQQEQENYASIQLYSIFSGGSDEGNDEDDEYKMFNKMKGIPSDLRPKPATASKPLSQHHQRSESSLPILSSRSPFRLVRSRTHVPPRPKFFRRLQRSHSMAFNHNVDTTNSDVWGNDETANTEVTELDAIERTTIHGPPQTFRKVARAQRRHSLSMIPHSDMIRTSSTTTTSSSTATSASLSSSNLFHGSMTSFPDVMEDEASEIGSTKKSEPTMFLSSSQLNDNNSSNNMSPEPPSIGSSSTGCRKRGASTSSISDLDEYVQLSGGSLSSKRRNQSNSLRIFSPPPGKQLPSAPCLDRSEDYDDFDLTTSFGCHHQMRMNIVTDRRTQDDNSSDEKATNSSSHRDRAEDMDQDTSIEEDHSEQDSSPDISFEAVDNLSIFNSKIPIADSAVVEDESTKIKRIIDTMPSIEDLMFVINQLKDEERRGRHLMVGAGDMWKIAPPLQQWTSHRRTTFIHWAKVSLGFTVRSGGMGYMFVQIHKTRGAQLVELLEVAKITYMVSEAEAPFVTHQQPSYVQTESPLLFSGHLSNFALPDITEKRIPPSEPPSRLFQRVPNYLMIDSDTEELTDKISSLSMTSESKNLTVATGHSQIGSVTLPTNDENVALCNQDKQPLDRLSTDQMGARSISSRPSFDCHTQSGELSLHFLGHSPRISVGRPPKVGGTIAGSMRHSRTPNTVENLCFVTTPQMAKDRGWGSRPIGGKDWGTSANCDDASLCELVARFELSLMTYGVTSTRREWPISLLNLSQHDFDLEADDHKQMTMQTACEAAKILAQENADRLHRKGISKYNKMKRMSLFAVNPEVNMPSRKTYCPAPFLGIETIEDNDDSSSIAEQIGEDENVVASILSFLNESELMTKAFPVCMTWSDYATVAHANLLVASIQNVEPSPESSNTLQKLPILEISWKTLHYHFPWACFLAEGGAKKVYKVYNSTTSDEEALSVMDTKSIDNIQIVANELAVSAMVSSLVRRGVCPNFISLHRVFTCAHAPPESHWGSSTNKLPKGMRYDAHKAYCLPKAPKKCDVGRYQYMQMQLANGGDAEELIKRQHDQLLTVNVARAVLFQVSYALFAAAERFSIKHYDVKLLNVFIQNTNSLGDLILRYGLGSHIFALKMPPNATYIAKLADFGTSNMAPSTNGLPVTISHFTTLENTPPDYLILGDNARQGHSHDNFGLGLIMLHLFTGFRPYEEILEDVRCPINLRERLKQTWENEKIPGYSVVRSVIFDGVDVDEYGNVRGESDDTLYDTLYRYLVLFGIPKQKFQEKNGRLVWQAITDSLQGTLINASKLRGAKKSGRRKSNNDCTTFKRDCKKYSIRTGTNIYIARARDALAVMEGGLDLLFRLCHFDPTLRATAMDALNSKFMDCLREQPEWGKHHYDPGTDVRSYTSFSTTNG